MRVSMDTAIVGFLLVYFIILANHRVYSWQCGGSCTKSTASQAIDGQGFDKHIIKTMIIQNVPECALHCSEDCSCQAFQLHGDHCDLLHETRMTAPRDFKQCNGYSYYDFEKQYINKLDTCPQEACENSCCKSQPCQHNGACTELCVDAKQKFNCTCPINYTGKYCEVQKWKSCKELFSKSSGITSGYFHIYDDNGNAFPTFCEFNSNEGISWTLVESFALRNRLQFQKPFYIDYPVNENYLQWDAFRFSLNRMKQLKNISTHFRGTCNFPVNGLTYTDYIRAKLSDIDLVSYTRDGCFNWEYFSVRGHSCTNCNAQFVEEEWCHPHTDSYFGPQKCLFKGQRDGAIYNEDNFGSYSAINPAHACSSSDSATTQWWIGS